jgi:hypothetical protein
MKKPRANSKCCGLPPEHLATLESWLFDDHLSLDDALARAKKELGFDGSRSGLHRFFQTRSRERSMQDLAEAVAQVSEIESAPGTEGRLFNSGMKLLAQRFLSRVIEDGATDLATLANLLLQSEANEIKREENELRKQALELRRQRLELDRERWELEKIGRKLDTAAKVDKTPPTVGDEHIAYYEEKRANLCNRLIYGKLTPDDLLPESEAEEEAQHDQYEKEREAWEREQAQLKAKEPPLHKTARQPAAAAPESTSPGAVEKPSSAPASVPAVPENAAGDPITKGPSSRDVPVSPGSSKFKV